MDDYYVPTHLGSTPDDDLKLLAHYVDNLDFPDDHVIVEIGSGRGKSTITMALVSRHKIIAIDPHEGPWFGAGNRLRRMESGSTAHDFIRNLRVAKVQDKVELIQQYSDEVDWNGRPPIALLFLDGDHSFASVRIELRQLLPHLALGAYVIFHDYAAEWFPGVVAAADQVIRKGLLEYVDYYEVNTPNMPNYDPNKPGSFGMLVTRKC
jgi:predicted O-methyltransferase YrrM